MFVDLDRSFADDGKQTVSVKGLFLTVQFYIKSQPDPKNPSGTIISVSSGFAGKIHPGFSAYSVGKLGEQRLGEYVDAGMISSSRRQSRPTT